MNVTFLFFFFLKVWNVRPAVLGRGRCCPNGSGVALPVPPPSVWRPLPPIGDQLEGSGTRSCRSMRGGFRLKQISDLLLMGQQRRPHGGGRRVLAGPWVCGGRLWPQPSASRRKKKRSFYSASCEKSFPSDRCFISLANKPQTCF